MLNKLVITVLLTIGTLASATPQDNTQSQEQNQNSAVQITRQPTVESTTADTATIAWSTNVQAGTKLIYGTDPNHMTLAAMAPWGGVTHRVYLKNLQPNTTYFFQALSEHAFGSGSSVSSSVSQFKTPPSRETTN